MALDGFEVLLGVDGGGALGEDVQRIAGDDVELIGGGQQVVARVVEHNPGLGILVDLVILLTEKTRGGGWDHGLDFADGDVLDRRIPGEGAGADSGAEAYAKDGFRRRVQYAGQVAHHALQLHVVGLGGGFHVAVDVNLDGAIVPARDGHRGIAAFDGVKHFALARVQRHAASVSDEFAGNGREVAG